MDTKKLISGCMAMLVLAGSFSGISAQAGIVQQTEGQRIQQVPERSRVLHMQADLYEVEEWAGSGQLSLKSTQTSAASYRLADSEWAASGSDYYFSLMDTAEKNLYINLKKQADLYLTGTGDFQKTKVMRDGKEAEVYVLPTVSYQGLTTVQMKKVFTCFLFENPQYYFMRNSVIYSEQTKMMTIGLYEIFADGSKREAYTAQFVQQLAEWEEQIAAKETVVEKERLIHQLVCGHVAYGVAMATEDPDDMDMSQSCISAILFDHSSVCTGYAQLFSLLCNRAGIECVTVTSAGHAWNKVRMGSIWYNVDCTWNDSRSDEAYLNVTDAQLQAEDSADGEHVLDAGWEGIAPPCTVLFDQAMANGADVSANVLTPGKMGGITVLSREKGKVSVSFQPLEGCDGYTVQYAANTSMEPSKKKNMEKTSCAITGLTSGKAYYVRVRAYAIDSNGEKLYGAYSKKLKVTVK